MTPDQLEFLSVLNAHNVKYLLIGGYAVGVHSEPRTTKDLTDVEALRAAVRATQEKAGDLG